MSGRWQKVAVDLGVIGVALVAGAGVVAVLGQSGGDQSRSSARPGSTGVASEEPNPSSSPVAVLVGAGDIADCERSEDELTAEVLETIPGTVFTLGDHAYPNASREDFEACYGPTWGRPSIKERTRPTIGDDDYDTPGAAAYFEYFGEAAGDPATGYYAYDAGAWRVYVINSQCRLIGGCGEQSPQDIWLREDLAANPRHCVLAMWHEPFFSSGLNDNDSMRHLWRVLYEAGAEIILGANHHAYERFGPQTPAGAADAERGIVQFVVGTAGGSADGFGPPMPNSLVRASRIFGVLRLDLSPESYKFEFVDVAGPEFSDRGGAECH